MCPHLDENYGNLLRRITHEKINDTSYYCFPYRIVFTHSMRLLESLQLSILNSMIPRDRVTLIYF